MNWNEILPVTGDLAAWITAVIVTLAVLFALRNIRRILIGRFAAFARTSSTPIDDVIVQIADATHPLFLSIVALYAGAQFLDLPPAVDGLLGNLAIITVLAQAALWLDRAIKAGLVEYIKLRQGADALGASTVTLLGFVARVTTWSLAMLLVLGNLGFDVSALIASMGIGGIAVALAVQNILGDIFASLSISLDKPFVIGDFIVVDDILGTIEYVGVKTTRLRSLSGEQIVFANAELLKSRIRNYGRMYERRVLFNFGVVYQTPSQQLERIPVIIREIVEAQPQIRFDRAHFKSYGESSLDFEVVYYVLNPEYNFYMDRQQEINLELFRRFEQEGIEFAYPTRTLYIQGEAPPN